MFFAVLLYNCDMAVDIQINLNKFISNPSFAGKTIGVALSGGRDSVALAYALKKADVSLIAVNVEHGIRGESSVNDSKFVEEFCKKYDIPLLSFSVDVPSFCKQNGYTTEQGARILRYDIFDKVLSDGKCDFIALAHHADDQVETVFMRIIRGTGVRGLCGMSAVSGKYIRPLLDCTREDINDFIAKNELPYVDDETNFDTDYTRNFLREELEKIKQRFPALCTSVSRLCSNASEVCDYIKSNTPTLSLDGGEVKVDTKYFDECVIAKELVLQAAKLLGVCQDIEQRHFAIVLALKDAQNGKRVELSHGLVAHKDGEYIVFAKNEENNECEAKTFCEGEFADLGVKITKIESVCKERLRENGAENCNRTLYIDGDKLPQHAVLRRIKPGDYIQKFGGGTKSVGDFLTDKKVPLRKREKLVIVANGSEVFAIFGVEISKSVPLDCDTKTVFELKII